LWSADFQEYGTELIRQAGAQVGATSDQLDIEWKGDKIVVTVHGDSYSGTTEEEDEEDEEEDEQDEDDEDDTDVDTDEQDEQIKEDSDLLSKDDADSLSATATSSLEEQQPTGVNVIALARAINHILNNDEDAVGLRIAEIHEIEVTTPGASDEIEGVMMFEAYKGFEVIAQHQDTKSKNLKTVQGKLVERNDEFTIVNIKGRMKKMKNADVVSVKLPKAKKEKGVS
jgi:ribosome maturation factor RimP